jgi:sarcosine oxidase, subunit beta
MACGTSGNQCKNAAIAGKLMATLVEYCERGTDHDARPLRCRLPYFDREIDTDFYSRKRPINRESSFSVLGRAVPAGPRSPGCDREADRNPVQPRPGRPR